jgi:hypothetical protein
MAEIALTKMPSHLKRFTGKSIQKDHFQVKIKKNSSEAE